MALSIRQTRNSRVTYSLVQRFLSSKKDRPLKEASRHREITERSRYRLTKAHLRVHPSCLIRFHLNRGLGLLEPSGRDASLEKLVELNV